MFFIIPSTSMATTTTKNLTITSKFYKKTAQKFLSVSYMDRVIHKKKHFITQKCLKTKTSEETGFMLIEVEVSSKGKVQTRLVSTELKDPIFLQCALSVLNRTRFKSFKGSSFVTRIYRFFVL